MACEVGVSEIVKPELETLRLSTIECARPPLVPVMVILYDPVAVVDVVDAVRVEAPVPPDARVTVTGFNTTDGPVGEIETARFTAPVKPRLVRVIVDVADDPGVTASPLGFAVA
jgi:hypothetical protein